MKKKKTKEIKVEAAEIEEKEEEVEEVDEEEDLRFEQWKKDYKKMIEQHDERLPPDFLTKQGSSANKSLYEYLEGFNKNSKTIREDSPKYPKD